MKFRLDRRMKSYLSVYGGLEEGLARKINNAIESMENRSSDMSSKVEDAISAWFPFSSVKTRMVCIPTLERGNEKRSNCKLFFELIECCPGIHKLLP
ncbi:MAG: hypothetical protein B1H11_02380 [Desulfobacteraceae bacterium 4484_190.1]|nr:MAG: hypothetical protein B1H11_02380 [Desulfobacteraceae bacterium 4484_190.1]